MPGRGPPHRILEFVPVNLRFGTFEMDLDNRELRKGGTLIRLPPQPFQVLRLLAENGGELCTRDEIRQALWGEDTHVDFDRNLNVCMTQIRAALSDEPDAPRFIQTVPRRGYRFVAPVERVGGEVPALPEPAPRGRFHYWSAAAAAILLVGVLAWKLAPAFRSPALLAVLPFEDVSNDPRSAVFLDGLLEEMIAAFGEAAPARLGVIARTSVKHFQGSRAGASQIGAELGARYLVEGTVRWEGPRVRVAARLIDGRTQAQIAGEAAEIDAAGAFAAQQQVAARISAAFVNRLFPGAVKLAGRPAHPAEASQAYGEGRIAQHLHTRQGLERSVQEFRTAIGIDPNFAEAWSAMAESYLSTARAGASQTENFGAAREAALHALQLDERLAEAHNVLANVLFWNDWNWAEAESQFRRAVALNPSFAPAQHDYAFFLVARGRTRKALAGLQRALALDPLSPRVQVDSGWLLLQAHRFEEAQTRARRSLELDPGFQEAFSCLMRAALVRHDYPAAVSYLNRTLPQSLDASDPEVALRNYLRERVGSIRDPILGAAYQTFLGNRAAALDLLDAAFTARRSSMVFLRTEPMFAPLHGDPRFEALVDKMGLR